MGSITLLTFVHSIWYHDAK